MKPLSPVTPFADPRDALVRRLAAACATLLLAAAGASAGAQTTTIGKPPNPNANQTSELVWSAMSAAARAAATNPTAAQTANLQVNAAIERYRMHDFAGARSAAVQALIDANQPATPALRPLQPIAPRSAYAPAHSPYVQTAAPPLNLAGIAEVDADGFIAQARGSLQACRERTLTEHQRRDSATRLRRSRLPSPALHERASRSEAHDRPVRALAARDQSPHPVAAL